MNRSILFLLSCAFVISATQAGVELTSAKIYKKQGEYAKSLEFYDQAVAKDPSDPEALFERGELLGEIAMRGEHIGLRNKASGNAENPQRALLERMIGDFNTVRANGEDKKAKKYLKKIDQLTQEYWWEFYSQAVAADSMYRVANDAGDTTAAMAAVDGGLAPAETALILDPNHWSSWFVYAQLLGFKHKDDAFVKAWHQAIDALESSSLKNDDAANYAKNLEYARLQLIQHFYAQQDHANTLKMSDELLQSTPGSVEAVQYKAFTLATMANEETRPVSERDSLKRVALNALTDAKTANEEDENIIYYIGQFNLQLKDTASALAAFDEYLGKAPTDRDVLFTQGLIYLEGEKFGDLQKAIDKFGAITTANPEDGAAWINYGIALIRQGKTEQGSEAVKKGEELSGN